MPDQQPGVHEVRIVIEGKVPLEPVAKKGRGVPVLSAVPFQREQAIRWFVPVPSNEG
jgi:hypothetical protein